MLEANHVQNGYPNANVPKAGSKDHENINRRLLYYAHHPQFISHRLNQLDRETSVEQLLKSSSATVSLTGLLLSLLANKRWLLLSIIATSLLFLNSSNADELFSLLKKQGYRSQDEIDQEKQVLRALRGGFDNLGTEGQEPEDRVRQIINSISVR